MLLCDSCVRAGIKMVMVMSILIKKKKKSSTASLKRGTFISSFLVIVPRITEGEILDFVKRQTMGPAADTVNGEKVHTNLQEESWMAPFLWIGYSTGGLFLFSFFFLNFFPLESVLVWAWTQPLRGVQGQDPPDFPVGLILPSKVQGLIQALQKGRYTSGAVGRGALDGTKTSCPVLEPFFGHAGTRTKHHCVPEGSASAKSLGNPIPLQQLYPFLSSSLP